MVARGPGSSGPSGAAPPEGVGAGLRGHLFRKRLRDSPTPCRYPDAMDHPKVALVSGGAGGIGAAISLALARAGREVVGIARGARLKAIRADGVMFRTPHFAERVHFPCVSEPSEIDFRPDDMMMLAMKTQDTVPALERLRAAGWNDGPIYCAQNGISNEDLALRVFPNVHGVLVMMPASYTEIDEATAFSTPRHGVFESGRYPTGADEDDQRFADVMEAANIGGFVAKDVMAAKTGKLLLNLGNIIQAAVGLAASQDAAPIRAMVAAEAKEVLAAAGIPWRDVGAADPRRDQLMKQERAQGATAVGGSTSQSLARGLGSVETDYLNGEIARLGRLHGVPAPANAMLTALGAELARKGARPGAVSVEDLRSRLA